MRPSLTRALFAVLIVRAIFLSPVEGSEFGPASQPVGSRLKKHDPIRPTRLRFPRPAVPSASQERFDCCDGGDGDEGDRPVAASSPERPSLAAARWLSASRPVHLTAPRSLVRLRC